MGIGSRGVVFMVGIGKFFVGGNWKCNGMIESIKKFVDEFNSVMFEEGVEVVVLLLYLYIS